MQDQKIPTLREFMQARNEAAQRELKNIMYFLIGIVAGVIITMGIYEAAGIGKSEPEYTNQTNRP